MNEWMRTNGREGRMDEWEWECGWMDGWKWMNGNGWMDGWVRQMMMMMTMEWNINVCAVSVTAIVNSDEGRCEIG